MGKKIIRLANSIHWDSRMGDKEYLDTVQLVLTQFPFTNREVLVRFSNGLSVDLSTYDMDRLVVAYLKLRGASKPIGLTHSEKPDRCDFTVDHTRNS